MSFWKWSRTAANNATADGSINWAEGQAPSSVNDSARAMMAAAAKYRDDVAGAIATGGTAAAYTLSSFQAFDTLANMNGAIVAFTAHVTNTGSCTLNVDGLGAKALRSASGAELTPGILVAGTIYAATYFNASNQWILHGFYGRPYDVPLGVALPFFGMAVPNSNFAFPAGQAISRTTYATLFSMLGTAFGAGDGSTTFNLPGLGGRLLACRENMNGAGAEGRITSAGSGIDGATLGAAGGAEIHTLTTGQLPAHSHPNSLNDPTHAHPNSLTDPTHSHPNSLNDPTHSHPISPQAQAGSGTTFAGGGVGGASQAGASGTQPSATGISISNAASATGMSINNAASATGISITNAAAGGGGAHNNMPPTMICNFIMRII
jgi:microcystin-dependent protein